MQENQVWPLAVCNELWEPLRLKLMNLGSARVKLGAMRPRTITRTGMLVEGNVLNAKKASWWHACGMWCVVGGACGACEL